MTRQRIDPKLKAQAIAELMVGESPAVVARKTGINYNTVRSLALQLRRVPIVTVATSKKEELGRLLFEYLAESLRSLAYQAVAFRDAPWLKRYEPDKAAILHGVMAERITRILGAVEPDSTESEPPRLLPPRDADIRDAASYPDDDRRIGGD